MNIVKYEKMIDERLATLKEEMIDEMMKKIEEEKENEFPKFGDEVWYICGDGKIRHDIWKNCAVDKDRFLMGNIFLTREEAEFEVERRKVIVELERYTESKNREWNIYIQHFYFYYSIKDNKIHISYHCDYKDTTLLFESREKVEEAIRMVGEDRIKKYYLRVED